MKHIPLLIVSLFLSQLLRTEDVKFLSVSDLFGVSRHEFISLCKDNNGFVWASSNSKVIRLTTNDYRSYSMPYASKDVVFVEMASNGRELAAYTNNKQIFRYNEVADRFDLLQLPTDRDLWISELLIGEDGDYWIATRSGLFRYHSDEKQQSVVLNNIGNETFGKNEFAAAMNVSPSLLYMKIKSFTDQSVVEFINSIRMNRSIELLQSKKYTITEVANLCGFSSLKYFSASFKDYFGKKPSEV